MTEVPSTNQPPDPFAAKDFGGIFYPVGYFVAAFPNAEDAQQARQELSAKGFSDSAGLLKTGEEMSAFLEKNLSENSGFLATLGKSDDAAKVQLDTAKKGATFLLVYAPDDEHATPALDILRARPFEFIHRYHRLAIEEIPKQNPTNSPSLSTGSGSPVSGV